MRAGRRLCRLQGTVSVRASGQCECSNQCREENQFHGGMRMPGIAAGLAAGLVACFVAGGARRAVRRRDFGATVGFEGVAVAGMAVPWGIAWVAGCAVESVVAFMPGILRIDVSARAPDSDAGSSEVVPYAPSASRASNTASSDRPASSAISFALGERARRCESGPITPLIASTRSCSWRGTRTAHVESRT